MTKFDSNWVPQSAMTIFAHPDDMEFSCGATLAKWAKAGCEITVVLCTSGNVGSIHNLHVSRFTRRRAEAGLRRVGRQAPRISAA